MDQSTLSRIEKGDRRPTLAQALRIRDKVGIAADDWLMDLDTARESA